MIKENYIENYLDSLIPNPVCELSFNKDYELLIAVMLSAQTTDKRVNKVTEKLFNKYPTIKELAAADISSISDIVRELGNFRKKSVAVISIAKKLFENYDGKVPNNRNLLEELPMVGRKTANVVLSVLFNELNIAVDTHVSRVSKRLGLAQEKDNVFQIERKLQKHFKKENWSKLHHQLVLFGRYYCLARNPKCDNCDLKKYCLKANKKD